MSAANCYNFHQVSDVCNWPWMNDKFAHYTSNGNLEMGMDSKLRIILCFPFELAFPNTKFGFSIAKSVNSFVINLHVLTLDHFK